MTLMDPSQFVEITTVIGCGMVCKYCPQAALRANYGSTTKLMTVDVFRTCIHKIPTSVEIHFSGFAEPWLNPEATDMCLYAHHRGHPIQVYSTLIGMSGSDLTRIRHIRLAGRGLCVHLPDADGLMRLTLTDEYINVLSMILAQNDELTSNLRLVCIGRLHPVIADLLRAFRTECRAPAVVSRGANLDVRPFERSQQPEYRKGAIRCRWRKIGRQPVLLPNGDLYLCCCDYSLRHRMGSLLEVDTYQDVWHGEDFLRFLELLDSEDSDLLCRRCEGSTPRYSAQITSTGGYSN